MRRLFLRLSLGLIIAVAASHALATAVVFVRFGAERDRLFDEMSEAVAVHIVEDLEGLEPAARQVRAKSLGEAYGVHLRVIPADEVPPHVREDRPPPPDRHHALLANGDMLVLGAPPPPPPIPWRGPLFAVQLLGVLLIVGLVGYLLATPFIRDLRSLEDTVGRLGQGVLDVRSDLPETSPAGSLATGFNHMASRLQRLVSGERQLFQAVSHDLRTPNARIRFQLESLLGADDAPARAALIASIDDDLTEVDALLDEILTYLRFDAAGPVRAEVPFDLAPLLEDITERLAPIEPGLALTHTVDPAGLSVLAVRRWFARAIENLVTNAQRHATATIGISAMVDGDRVVIHVDDDGAGVPEADREGIFEPFASGDPSRSKTLGGVGLGLAIVKRILEQHGGRVEVTDSPTGGARFTTVWRRG